MLFLPQIELVFPKFLNLGHLLGHFYHFIYTKGTHFSLIIPRFYAENLLLSLIKFRSFFRSFLFRLGLLRSFFCNLLCLFLLTLVAFRLLILIGCNNALFLRFLLLKFRLNFKSFQLVLFVVCFRFISYL